MLQCNETKRELLSFISINEVLQCNETRRELLSFISINEVLQCNETRRELLSFISINEVLQCVILSSRKEKKGHLHADPAAPQSKKWHCNDYTVVRYSSRRCTDVSVICGAECNTDHQMLRMTLLTGKKWMFCRPRDGLST